MATIKNVKYDSRKKILTFDLIIYKEEIPGRTYRRIWKSLKILDYCPIDINFHGCEASMKGYKWK